MTKFKMIAILSTAFSLANLNTAIAQDCISNCIKVHHMPDANITSLIAPKKDANGKWIKEDWTAFWGDTSTIEGTGSGTKRRIGTAFNPGSRSPTTSTSSASLQAGWNIVSFNVGKFANDNTTIIEEPTHSVAGWPIKKFTDWDPLPPYVFKGKAIKQLSFSNNYTGIGSERSALQATGKSWGAYLNSDDWMNNNQNMTVRYGYNFGKGTSNYSLPRPFNSSLYGLKTAVLVEANIAISKYTGKTTDLKHSVGYGIMNIGFRDMKSGQFLTFIGKFFDWRGFTTANDPGTGFPKKDTYVNRIGKGYLMESALRVGTGEMCVSSHFGPETKYSSKTDDSTISQIAPWKWKKHFAYKISRKQFVQLIKDTNIWLSAHEPNTPMYSENPDDYIINGASVGIEMAKLTPKTDTNNKIEMSMIGDSFKISTLHN